MLTLHSRLIYEKTGSFMSLFFIFPKCMNTVFTVFGGWHESCLNINKSKNIKKAKGGQKEQSRTISF
jgi:hypothetical protein